MIAAFSPDETKHIIDRLMVQTESYYRREIFEIWIGKLIPQLNLNQRLVCGKVTVRSIIEVKLVVLKTAIQNEEAISQHNWKLSTTMSMYSQLIPQLETALEQTDQVLNQYSSAFVQKYAVMMGQSMRDEILSNPLFLINFS